MTIFRRMFGPSKDEVWRQLSSEIGANHVEGGFWKGSKVEARVDDWTVTLDAYTVSTGKVHLVFTRMRAPFVNADGLRFTIYRRGAFSEFAKMLGAQDIEIGDPEFDRAFMIKGNNPLKVRYLLGNTRLRQMIQAQPEIRLEIKDKDRAVGGFPDNADELCFTVLGIIKEVDRLKSLFELFGETLHQLCHIGSAYESDPNVQLK